MNVMNLMRKIAGILQISLQRIKRRFHREVEPVAVAEPVVEVSARQLAAPPCVQRIKNVLRGSGMRQRRGCTPGVWTVKVKNFADAYRFLLRMCDCKYICTIRQAGHVRYRVELPDGEGNIFLSDRVGNRKNVVAVMTFRMNGMPEIKEIWFRTILY